MLFSSGQFIPPNFTSMTVEYYGTNNRCYFITGRYVFFVVNQLYLRLDLDPLFILWDQLTKNIVTPSVNRCVWMCVPFYRSTCKLAYFQRNSHQTRKCKISKNTEQTQHLIQQIESKTEFWKLILKLLIVAL